MGFLDVIRSETLESIRQSGAPGEYHDVGYLDEEYFFGSVELARVPPAGSLGLLDESEPAVDSTVLADAERSGGPAIRLEIAYGYNYFRSGSRLYFQANSGPPTWRCLGWRGQWPTVDGIKFARTACGNTAIYQFVRWLPG